MIAIDPDYARMPARARAGVVLLCAGGGAVLGVIGTFAHQSLPPVGVAIALITVALYVVGLRIWGAVRTPAASGVIGVGFVSAGLATATNGSVLVPANAVGYAWLGGITVIAFVALAWPHLERAPRRVVVRAPNLAPGQAPDHASVLAPEPDTQPAPQRATDTMETSAPAQAMPPHHPAPPEQKDRPLP